LMVVEFSDQMSPFAGPLTHQKKGHHAMFWWWIHAKFLCFWMVQFKSHFSHLFNPWINGNLWPKVIEADAATLQLLRGLVSDGRLDRRRCSQFWPKKTIEYGWQRITLTLWRRYTVRRVIHDLITWDNLGICLVHFTNRESGVHGLTVRMCASFLLKVKGTFRVNANGRTKLGSSAHPLVKGFQSAPKQD
jgi:hypothetical protein